LDSSIAGPHWKSLQSLVPIYRTITRVEIGNGENTSFWLDAWHGDYALSSAYAALFDHSIKPDITVKEAIEGELRDTLVPRLSSAAQGELLAVQHLCEQTVLTAEPDKRTSRFYKHTDRAVPLHSAAIYRASMHTDVLWDYHDFVWRNYAPPRVKHFGWLLVHQRIQCKTNLLLKHIVDNDVCEICSQHEAPEDTDHIISGCPFSRDFWLSIGWEASELPVSGNLHNISPPTHIPSAALSTLLLLCCWMLWKHRNDVVFNGESPNLARLRAKCREECKLWRCRLPSPVAFVNDNWCALFNPM
jgi:hypothetical protein